MIIGSFKKHGIIKGSTSSDATSTRQMYCAACQTPIFCFPSRHLLKNCINIHIKSPKHIGNVQNWKAGAMDYQQQQESAAEKPIASTNIKEVDPASTGGADPSKKLRHKRKQLHQMPRVQDIVITKTLLSPTNQQFALAQRALQRQMKKARLSSSKNSVKETATEKKDLPSKRQVESTRVLKGTPRLWNDEKEMQLLQEIKKFHDQGIRRQAPPGSEHGTLDPNQVFCIHCDKPIVCLNITGYLNMKKIEGHVSRQSHVATVEDNRKRSETQSKAVSFPGGRKANTSKYYREVQLEMFAKDGILKAPPAGSKVGKLTDQQVYCNICDRALTCFVDGRFSSNAVKRHVTSTAHVSIAQKGEARPAQKQRNRPERSKSGETPANSARQNKLFLKQLEQYKEEGITEFLPPGCSAERLGSNQVYCRFCEKGIACFDTSGLLFYSKSLPRHIETRNHQEARRGESTTSSDSEIESTSNNETPRTKEHLARFKEEHGITETLPEDSKIKTLESNQVYCIPCQKPIIVFRASGAVSLQALERHVASENHKINLEQENNDDESMNENDSQSGPQDERNEDIEEKFAPFREHGITRYPPDGVELNSAQLYCLACEKAIICVRPTGIPNTQAIERHVTREGHLASFDEWQKKSAGSPRRWTDLNTKEKMAGVKKEVDKFARHGISMEPSAGSGIDALQPDQLFCRTCVKPIICFRANGSLSLQAIRRHVDSQSHRATLRSKQESGQMKQTPKLKTDSGKRREKSAQQQLDSFKKFGISDSLPHDASLSFLKPEQVYCTFCDKALSVFNSSGHLNLQALLRHVESQNHLFFVKSKKEGGTPEPKREKDVLEQLEKYSDDGITCEIPAGSTYDALDPNQVYCTVCEKPIIAFRSNLSFSQQAVERHIASNSHKDSFKSRKSQSNSPEVPQSARQDDEDSDDGGRRPRDYESHGISETLPPDATVDKLQPNQCYCNVCEKPIACYTKDGTYVPLWLDRHVKNQTHTAAAKK